MKKLIVIIVVGWLLGSGTALGYRPNGWVWFDGSYVYDWQWQHSWYFLNGTDTQWVCDLNTDTWYHLDDSVLASGWAFVHWPYMYSQSAQRWFYINKPNLSWCVRMDSGVWSWFGTQTCDTYELQVTDFKIKYGKSDEWETWMLANKSRYINVFSAARATPSVLNICFLYQSYIRYDPAWDSEQEHMNALMKMANGAYASYRFNIEYYSSPDTSYANIVAGIASHPSYASGKTTYLYYETIFNHEFGHLMNLLHHYDTEDRVALGDHMPPGDSRCIMDRSSYLFCSACRTALGIPLDATDDTAVREAITDILDRYPY